MTWTQVGIFEVFMATSYLPQNTHCIYIDGKSNEKIFGAVNGIVKCYREVFLQVKKTIIDFYPS
jgi:hypothetical protein